MTRPDGSFGRYRAAKYPHDTKYAQWTLKFKPAGAKNNISRLEYNWRVDGTPAQEILDGAAAMGFTFNFKINKQCHIYRFPECTLVFYSVKEEGITKEDYYIEIEITEETVHELTEENAWDIIRKYEKILEPVGVNAQKRKRLSLFDMYRKRSQMKEIQLSRGKVALVDDEDYEAINQFKWNAASGSNKNTYYARRSIYLGEKDGKKISKSVQMHRSVLNIVDIDIDVDHIDGNGLNNTKKNLRSCSRKENSRNKTRKHPKNTSGFRGVTKDKSIKSLNKWTARIQKNGKRAVLGFFATPEEAARAFDKAAKEIYGEFCGKLNFE